MADIAKHWRAVGEMERSLPSGQDVFYVTSIGDDMTHRKGGVTVEVNRQMVGRLVVGGSHRLATEEEIDAWKKSQHDHAVEVKMRKLNTDSAKAVEMFDAITRLSQANLIPSAAPEQAAKKPKGGQ